MSVVWVAWWSLVVSVVSATQHYDLSVYNVEFDQIKSKLGTGDLVFWSPSGQEAAFPEATGGSNARQLNFSHVGMIMKLPAVDVTLVWEAVIYDHVSVQQSMDPQQQQSPIGGAVRLIDLHLLRMSAPAFAIRQLAVPSGDSLTAAIRDYWKQVEHLPDGATLADHGEWTALEGDYTVRTMDATLRQIGILPAATADDAPLTMADLLSSRVPYQSKLLLVPGIRSLTAAAQTAFDLPANATEVTTPSTPLEQLPVPEANSEASAQETAAAPSLLQTQAETTCNVDKCDSVVHAGMLSIRLGKVTGLQSTSRLLSDKPLIRFSQHPRFYTYTVKAPLADPVSKAGSGKSAQYSQTLCMCVFRFTPDRRKGASKDETDYFTKSYDPKFDAEFKAKRHAMAAKDKDRAYEEPAQRIFVPTLRAVVLNDAMLARNAVYGEVRWDLNEVMKNITSKSYPLKALGGASPASGSLDVAFDFTPMPQQLPAGACSHTNPAACLLPRNTAKEKYWNEFQTNLDSGDMVFFRGGSLASAIAMKVFDVRISHTGVIYRCPQTDIVLMFHALNVGVIVQSLRHYAFSGREDMVMARHLVLPPKDDKSDPIVRSKLIGQCVSEYVGKPYNTKKWFEIVRAGATRFNGFAKLFGPNKAEAEEAFFCSELVAVVYRKMKLLSDAKALGTEIANNFQPTDLLPPCQQVFTGDDIQAHGGCGGKFERVAHDTSPYPFYLTCPGFLRGLPHGADLFEDAIAKWWLINPGVSRKCADVYALSDKDLAAGGSGEVRLPTGATPVTPATEGTAAPASDTPSTTTATATTTKPQEQGGRDDRARRQSAANVLAPSSSP